MGISLAFPLNQVTPDDLVRCIHFEKRKIVDEARKENVEIIFVRTFSDSTTEHRLQILPTLEYFEPFIDDSLLILKQLRMNGIASIVLTDDTIGSISVAESLAKNKLKRTLSVQGKRIVQELNQQGIRIDISHLCEELQLEVIRASASPVYASHANIRAIADIERNLTEPVLRELTRTNGLVLLTFDRAYLYGNMSNRQSGLSVLFRHIHHVVSGFGIHYVGLGSDFGGSGENAPADLNRVECFPKIYAFLKNQGYTDAMISLIMSGNIIRYFGPS